MLIQPSIICWNAAATMSAKFAKSHPMGSILSLIVSAERSATKGTVSSNPWANISFMGPQTSSQGRPKASSALPDLWVSIIARKSLGDYRPADFCFSGGKWIKFLLWNSLMRTEHSPVLICAVLCSNKGATNLYRRQYSKSFLCFKRRKLSRWLTRLGLLKM